MQVWFAFNEKYIKWVEVDSILVLRGTYSIILLGDIKKINIINN